VAKVRGAVEAVRRIKEYPQQYRRAALAELTAQATITQERLKSEAPWIDKTGAARRGLYAVAFEEGTRLGIRAGHTVPYGRNLEYGYQGRNAVVQPVMRTAGPRAMRAVAKAVKAAGKIT
jgi:hypothetical protein